MANSIIKNYGLSGVHRILQFGKRGPKLIADTANGTLAATTIDGETLTTMSGANASNSDHFITKAQLDVVYTEAQFLANVNYNSSSPILLGNISSGTKTIITTFEVDTVFDGNAVVTIGTSSNNSLLVSDNYAEIEVVGTYQTTGLFEFAADTALNIYVTQGGATQGVGKVLVSVVDGPVVDGGTINYGTGSGGIALTDLSVTTNSPSGNGSLSYSNTTGVFTFTPANTASAGGEPAYKGFKSHYGRMWDNNDDPNGPINKIVIYKETATPSSTIDTSTNNDTFNVTGLTGSDIVAMLVVIGDNITQTPTNELKTFAESIIDNVILDGGVEGQFNNITDMRSAFYSNFNTFSATVTDRKADLEFFSVNNQFNINPQYSTGDGATFSGISYNMDNDTLDLGSWGQGAPNTHEVNDVHVIPGNTIQDANSNFLLTPDNDVTVTITGVSDGAILSYTVTGTLPRPAVVWPSNSIGDGGDDEYDTGNYINTDLDSEISYNDGNVVTSSSAFGGGDYVVTYNDGIFGVFAANADISSIGTSGNSGFDGNGQADTGSLYGAEAGVNIGDFVFTNSTLTATDNGGDLFIKAGDDLWLDALDDDVHIRANDDVRIKVGYDFQDDSIQAEWRFDTDGAIKFPDGSSQSTAWTGSVDYTDVNNRPTIPADVSELTDTTNLLGGGIALSNLSVSVNSPSGNGSLTYSNTTGVFTFTPADVSSVAGNYSNSNVVTLLSSFGSNTILTTGNVTTGILISTGSIFGNVDFVLGDTANVSATKTRLVSDTTFSYIQTGNGTVGSTGNIVFAPYSSTTQRVVIDTASGNITSAGNVIAQNFSGNISITGNVTGTSQNVSLVAGSFTTTFDNTGNLVLPGNTFAVNYANGTPVDVVTRFESSWAVPTGNSTQSFTVDGNHTYYMWVEGNIPNGIIVWNATATVTNTNVPVVGAQYAWVYDGGGTPIDFTSIPNQFIGTSNTIVRNSVAPSATTNRFDFGINNTSGGNVTVRYGWVKIS